MDGFEDSIAAVHAMIDRLVARGYASENIFVGGFSQGGALALASVSSCPRKLAGCIILSGWTAFRSQYPDRLTKGANGTTPFLLCHGTRDPVVLPECSDVTEAVLTECGVPVTVLRYGIPALSW
jgi:predicted esterase